MERMKRTPWQAAAMAVVSLLLLSLCFGEQSAAATRGKLYYESSKDAGALVVSGPKGKYALIYPGDRDLNGRLVLYDPQLSASRVMLDVDSVSQGRLVLYGSQGNAAARLNIQDDSDQGVLQLCDRNGKEKSIVGVHKGTESGYLTLSGKSSNSIVEAGRAKDGQNQGEVCVYSDGKERALLQASPTTDSGRLVLRNSNGEATITLNGKTGEITKSGSNGFLVVHPEDPTKEIHYVSLEGPENGMYVRGTARLEKGRALVKLPKHFAMLAVAEGMTVQITPGSADTYGLAVVGKSPEEIEIRELAGGTGSYPFDYTVFASRKDVLPLQVIQDRVITTADASTSEGLVPAAR